jgi:hypothetical protein
MGMEAINLWIAFKPDSQSSHAYGFGSNRFLRILREADQRLSAPPSRMELAI